MNHKMIFNMLGRILGVEAILMILPAVCALYYGETTALCAFLLSIAIALAISLILILLVRPKDKTIYAREGFIIVAIAWICLSAIGALPFVISGEIPSYVDAFFETVSGFTTTGASILTRVEALSHGILFWRSFTHWIGGMGILVMVIAILPTDSGRSIHLIRAEVPGPVVGKLVPKIRTTASILYLMYLVLTVSEVIFLLCGDMDVFEALVHAFGTAGTGGFGIKGDSLGSYSSYTQWVIIAFMFLFGVNFNLYFLLFTRHFRSVFKSGEFWFYTTIFVSGSALITANIYPLYKNVGDSVRHAAFQTASILTTTGYSTADFNQWPGLSKGLFFLLMFVGACAGSTAGGLKLSRVMVLGKTVTSRLRHMVHPRSVEGIRMEGKRLDDETVSGVYTYFALYCLCIVMIFFLLCFENFDIETNFSAAVSCFNNIGPGLGKVVGPAGSYAQYSPFAKIVLTIAMLLGRLEIYPILLLFFPGIWAHRRKTLHTDRITL